MEGMILALFIVGILIFLLRGLVAGNDERIPRRRTASNKRIIENVRERIAKANGAVIEHYSMENLSAPAGNKEDIFANAEFENKGCTNLDDFIINDRINSFDLMKLAQLNGVDLQIREGWYPMLLDMLRELDAKGWDRRVTCIKEKYASLRFHTAGRNEVIEKIVDTYESKSSKTCETCGEKGVIRYHRYWDYVACRAHYVENRGTVGTTGNGFVINGSAYNWKDVKDILFEDEDGEGRYKFVKVEFKKALVQHPGWTDEKLFIQTDAIGYGNFLGQLPANYKSLDYNYLKNFDTPRYCEICGYKAVYFGTCECCENDTWEHYLEKWPTTSDTKEEHIKYEQLMWAADDGDMIEAQQANYLKNTAHKLLFTAEELQEYRNDEDDFTDESP